MFIAAYSGLLLAWEDFTSNDEAELTDYSVRGIDFPAAPIPEEGRFCPLSLQEFNYIRYITTTAAGYHAFPVAQVLALAVLFLLLDLPLHMAARAILISLALLTPSVAFSFTGLVFTERSIVFLLICLAISVEMFERTHSRWWAVAAVLSAQIMLYLKEPVFLLLLGFAGARLILRHREQPLGNEESRLDLCIAAVSLAFAAFYLLMMFPHTSAGYLASQHVTLWETVRFYFTQDPLAWLFSATVCIRFYLIFRRRVTPQLLWDGLAAGGVVYFGTYVVLRMARNYYLAPVDFLAVLYLGQLLFSSWPKMRLPARIGALALAVVVIGLNLFRSADRIVARKYINHEKMEIARVILQKYRNDPQRAPGLYFPFSDPWVMADFLSYLRYRGLPLEDVDGSGTVRIFRAKAENDGRCWRYTSFLCHPVDGAAFSLVVILPDDPVWPAEEKVYFKSAQPLFSYTPGPLLKYFDHLPTVYVGEQ